MPSPAEQEMQAALAQIGNEMEPKEAMGRIEGNKTEDTSLAKNTEMAAQVEDDDMTEAPPPADDTVMNDDPPPADDKKVDDDPPPAPVRFTRAQSEATKRVLQCSSDDYYGILDLERSCGEDEVKSAYRKWSKLTHPDRNRLKGSTKAFQSKL
jgi:DnaJ domain